MNRSDLLSENPELQNMRLLRRLSGGGGWNETWLAARDEERLVVRLDTPAVAALGLNRAGERSALRSIRGRRLGPELIFFDILQGVLVTRWLPGRPCMPEHVRRPRFLRALGEVLRRLHETVDPPPGAEPLNLSRSADHYAALIGAAWARRAAREADRSLKAAASDRRRPSLCHNDPVAQNILCGPELRLIDWEFASPGDPLFDLAVVVGHHDLDARQARTLLAAARGRAHPSDLRGLTHQVACYGNVRRLWEAAVREVKSRSSCIARIPV